MIWIKILILSILFFFCTSFYRKEIDKENILFNFSYAVIFLSIYINFFIFLKKLNIYVVFLPIAILLVLSILNIKKNIKSIKNFDKKDFTFFLLFFSILLLFSGILPFYKDELVYHLEVPRQFWLNGGFIELKRNFYSYFPEGIENIFLIFLSHKLFFPQISRFIHSLFFFNTVILLSIMFKKIKDKYILLLFFISTPTLFIVSTYGYIDSAIMFFFTMGIYSFLYLENPYYILFFGLILPGIKYTGIFYFILLFLLFLLKLKENKNYSIFKNLEKIVIPLIFSAPFYIKNFTLTGNPLFPFYSNIFKSHNPFWNNELYDSFIGFLKTYGIKLSPILKPFSIFLASFNFKPENPKYFDGVIGLIGILWILFIFFIKKYKPQKRYLFLISIFGVIYWSFTVREVRFLFFLLPLFTLLFVYSYAKFPEKLKKITNLLIIFLTLFNFYIVFSYFRNIGIQKAIIGKETFLSKNVDMFNASKFLNKTSPNSRVFMVESSNENFYLNRKYISDYIVTDYTFYHLIKNSQTPLDIMVFFKKRKINYLLIKRNWINSPIFRLGIENKLEIVKDFFNAYLVKVYEDKNYQIYKFYSKPSSSTQHPSGKISMAFLQPMSARFSSAEIREYTTK